MFKKHKKLTNQTNIKNFNSKKKLFKIITSFLQNKLMNNSHKIVFSSLITKILTSALYLNI